VEITPPSFWLAKQPRPRPPIAGSKNFAGVKNFNADHAPFRIEVADEWTDLPDARNLAAAAGFSEKMADYAPANPPYGLANGPLSTRDIATYVIQSKGLDLGDKVLAKAIGLRLIHALRRQRQTIVSIGRHKAAHIWRLHDQRL
jgi:hypothetical protein